jgi:hypothetical protein
MSALMIGQQPLGLAGRSILIQSGRGGRFLPDHVPGNRRRTGTFFIPAGWDGLLHRREVGREAGVEEGGGVPMRGNLPDCMPRFRGALGLYLGRDGRWDVDSDSHRAWGSLHPGRASSPPDAETMTG